jgi:TfoX/Sxy family transcriptional regulator of competence genes
MIMADAGVLNLQAVVEAAMPYLPTEVDLAFKHMFGGITGYAHGRNFVSLSNVGLALKLPNAVHADLLKIDGAKYLQYAPDEPVSKQSLVLPAAVLADREALGKWLKISIDYVSTLPLPKKKSAKK